MEQEDPRDAVRYLAVLAGVPMTSDRIAATALALPAIVPTVRALWALELGETEPACRFQPPRRAAR